MYYYLYWDESALGNETKLFRSLYSSYEEALHQAKHDMKCFQCDGTGEEDSPWGPQKCRSCKGSGENWSKQIVGIEESEVELGGADRSSLQRGKLIWTPENKE